MFGLINGLGYVAQLLLQKYLRKPKTTPARMAYQWGNWFLAMGIVCLSFIFFRSQSLEMAVNYTREILSRSLFANIERPYGLPLLVASTFFLIEWQTRNLQHPLNGVMNIPSRVLRWGIYYLLIFALYHFGAGDTPKPFIYFQF
jgi:D-alanyl-lipoteichoic acid acyltransferase DltB (MBOAT superfamily)